MDILRGAGVLSKDESKEDVRWLLKQTLKQSIQQEIPHRELTTINQTLKCIWQVPSSSGRHQLLSRVGMEPCQRGGRLQRCDRQLQCSCKKAETRGVRHRVQEPVLVEVKQEKQFGPHQPGAKSGLPIYPLLRPRTQGKKISPFLRRFAVKALTTRPPLLTGVLWPQATGIWWSRHSVISCFHS